MKHISYKGMKVAYKVSRLTHGSQTYTMMKQVTISKHTILKLFEFY